MQKIFQYYEVRPTLVTTSKVGETEYESFNSEADRNKAYMLMKEYEADRGLGACYTLYGRSWDVEVKLWLPTPIQDFDTIDAAFEMFTAITGLMPPEKNFEPLHGHTGDQTVARFAALLAASSRKPEASFNEELPVSWAVDFMVAFPVWEDDPDEREALWEPRTLEFFNKVWPEFRVGDMVCYAEGSGHAFRSGGCWYPGAVVIQVEPLVCASTGGDMRWESTIDPEHLEFHDIASPAALEAAMTRLVN